MQFQNNSMILLCPEDSGQVTPNSLGAYQCSHCQIVFKINNGVIVMMPDQNKFYEGSYLNHIKFIPKSENPFLVWPLWFIQNGYVWNVRKYVPKGAAVVELGCAGGIAYFGRRYQMVGIDISLKSLQNARNYYNLCIQSNVLKKIPLPDESVDAVISSFFWEHLGTTSKVEVLMECRRVLKPKGTLIFLYDIDTQNPLISKYKKNAPLRYAQVFLDADGHLGYESFNANNNRFSRCGFTVIKQKQFEKTCFQPPHVYQKLSCWEGAPVIFKKCALYLVKKPWFYFYMAVLRLIDVLICPFLPGEWSRIVLTVCKKNGK